MSMTSRKRKVLVLGDDDRPLIGVVRSLGRKGIEVHLAWCPSQSLVRRSRYVKCIHELPGYSETSAEWRRALVELMRREQFDLVIPCDDPVLIPLQRYRRELEEHGRI